MLAVFSNVRARPVFVLQNIGRRVCHSYHAVKNYENRQYPQYFHNHETLREAISEAWQVGDFRQKKIIIIAVESAGF